MPLENLLTLIEKLRERIDSHGDALRQSEALTRYALIDPLLRELGWDTEDPALVKPEYGSGRGFADYALFSNNGPIMMLEAKKLDEPLGDARRQAVAYAMDETGIKTRYLSVTDGAYWEIYDTDKPVSDMLAASFDLKSSSAADACLKALALWRPVISDQIAGGETPVIGSPEKSRDNVATILSPEEKQKHSQELIDINRATAEALQGVKGIGSEMAYRIVDYREKNGLFRSLDDIQKVKGIGTTKYLEQLKSYLKISAP